MSLGESTSQRLLDEAEGNTLRVLEVFCEVMQEVKGDLEKTGNEFSPMDFMMAVNTGKDEGAGMMNEWMADL